MSANPRLFQRPFAQATGSRQAGLTLLEVMVALTLGLLLLIGMSTAYLGTKQTYNLQEGNSRVQEMGRYVLELLGRSLRQAGYGDISTGMTKTMFQGTPISGTQGSGTAPDVLTVQYDWSVGDSACDGDTAREDGTAAVAGDWIQNSFSLDTANSRLRCDGMIAPASPPPLGAAIAPGAGQDLAEGAEDFQVLYGIDTDLDQSANRYVTADVLNPCPLLVSGVVSVVSSVSPHWCQVVSARVCILIRSVNQGMVPVGQSYLNCGGALGTSTGGAAFSTSPDTRLRRTFVATFNLRNRVSGQP